MPLLALAVMVKKRRLLLTRPSRRVEPVMRSLRALLIVGTLFAPAAAGAQQSPDQRVADLVGAGKVRVGLHLPQFVKDPATGEIRGSGTGAVIQLIAQAFAERLKVKLELVGHPSPPKLVECLKAEACDVGFLGFVPGRAGDVGYAPPHMLVPFTFMVAPGSSAQSITDLDKPGIRIAAVRNHASTLALRKLIKHAEMIGVEIPDEAFELVRNGKADAWASPRPPLLVELPKLPGARVLDGHYGANIQAMAVPKTQTARLDYVAQFVDEAKVSGLIQRAIDRAGERGIEVAPRDEEILTGSVPKR
jgi:polar amino acid transport system substrate-binding protein